MSVAEETGLSLALSENPKTGFSRRGSNAIIGESKQNLMVCS